MGTTKGPLTKGFCSLRAAQCECPLRSNVFVPPEGDMLGGGVVVVGEAGGETEGEQGRPFVGRTGKELRGALSQIEVPIDAIYNMVPRALRQHTPTKREVSACWECHVGEWLQSLHPRLLVAVGSVASSWLAEVGVERFHGSAYPSTQAGLEGVPVFVTFHPSAMVRNRPRVQPLFEGDFTALEAYYANTQHLDRTAYSTSSIRYLRRELKSQARVVLDFETPPIGSDDFHVIGVAVRSPERTRYFFGTPTDADFESMLQRNTVWYNGVGFDLRLFPDHLKYAEVDDVFVKAKLLQKPYGSLRDLAGYEYGLKHDSIKTLMGGLTKCSRCGILSPKHGVIYNDTTTEQTKHMPSVQPRVPPLVPRPEVLFEGVRQQQDDGAEETPKSSTNIGLEVAYSESEQGRLSGSETPREKEHSTSSSISDGRFDRQTVGELGASSPPRRKQSKQRSVESSVSGSSNEPFDGTMPPLLGGICNHVWVDVTDTRDLGDELAAKACEDVELTDKLDTLYTSELEIAGMTHIYLLERAIAPLVRRTEDYGMRINVPAAIRQLEVINSELAAEEASFQAQAPRRRLSRTVTTTWAHLFGPLMTKWPGHGRPKMLQQWSEPVNPRSTQQLAEMFDALGIELTKTTDTGLLSVDGEVLEGMTDPIAALLRTYRKVEKREQFVSALVAAGEWLHFRLKPLGAVSGRFSSGAGEETEQ